MPVFLAAKANVPAIWPHVAEMLCPLLAQTPTHEIGDVLQAIMDDDAQLWVQWNGTLEAFAVTEFAHYPRGTWLRIWLGCASRKHRLNLAEFWPVIDQWRESHGCRGFEIIGREGFLKKFPKAQREGVVMRMTVR